MTVLDSGFHTVDSRFRVLDSGFQLSGFRIPKKAGLPFFFFFLLDSGFLELDSGFESPGFWISKAKNLWILESGFPYMGRGFVAKCAVLSCRQNVVGFHFHLPSDCAILKE